MPAPRLADLLSALSLATDLGSGVPLETSMRIGLVATHLGRALGLGGAALAEVYYTGLLRHLGCTAWAHEAAGFAAGDDHDLIRTFEGVDTARARDVLGRAVGRLARGASVPRRVGAIAKVVTAPGAGARLAAAQCAQAVALAGDLGLGDGVAAALGQMYERHDGRGSPHGAAGDAIAPAARVLIAAQAIEAWSRQGGPALVARELRRRRGKHLAPEVADAALGDLDGLAAALGHAAPWEALLDAEPTPHRALAAERLGDVALAFARFTDLKTPHTIGHSPAVAALAADAAAAAGWPADEIAAVRAAALLHDLGAVSVPNGVWERPGALGASAWERVRMHAYWTERILARSPVTAPLAAIAGAHHERVDGGGYPKGARADALPRAARVLAAADVMTALGEARPHRPAFAPADAARLCGELAAAGQLDRDAVGHVLAAAGHARPRPALPAGLTEREAEVLGLVARGLSTREIADALGIAPRTVKHHIEHLYDKTGASTRAEAALFAARHDLIDRGGAA